MVTTFLNNVPNSVVLLCLMLMLGFCLGYCRLLDEQKNKSYMSNGPGKAPVMQIEVLA